MLKPVSRVGPAAAAFRAAGCEIDMFPSFAGGAN
jgi:hypothetical protein